MIRTLFKITLLITAIIAVTSCEENFSPVVEYDQTYALSCIIRGDTTLQVATLFSSYDLENGDAFANPAYEGAEIRLWYKDTVYWFKDSSIAYPKYKDSRLKFYYLDNFLPLEDGEPLEIEAMLKGGKRLKGKCFTPTKLLFDTGESSKIIPPVNTSGVNFLWYTMDEVSGYFVGRLIIKYFQNVNGEYQLKRKTVPIKYYNDNGKSTPIYPSPSKSASLIYDSSAVTQALKEISEGDMNKSNYKIIDNAVFEVLALEENASRYYSSTLEDNSFTVNVNELDYTNIEGGFGVFGSINQEKYTLKITPDYIMSFGYDVYYEE